MKKFSRFLKSTTPDMSIELKNKNILFISLGRPSEHKMLQSFLWQMAETFPQSQISGLMDAEWSKTLTLPKNLRPIFLEKNQFFIAGHQQRAVSVTAINGFLNKLEKLNFDHVYYLDSLIWGEWITTVFEKDIIKTISLSGFEGLPQKYRYLMDTFQCVEKEAKDQFLVTSKKDEFFARSLHGSRVLLIGEREFSKELFSKNQGCLSSADPSQTIDPESEDVQAVIKLWQSGAHRGNLTPAYFSDLDLFEVIGDEFTTTMVASQSRMEEYSHCQAVLQGYSMGTFAKSSDPHLGYASLRRLQGLTLKILENLESKRRLMQGLETRHLDLQLCVLTVETLSHIHGNFNKIENLKKPLVQFTNYLSVQIETMDAEPAVKSVKGKP